MSLIRSFMEPLFGTHTQNTTVIKLRGCSVELQGSSKIGIQDTLVFLIYLMCRGGHLFLKGDMRFDLFCFTKLLTVWHNCIPENDKECGWSRINYKLMTETEFIVFRFPHAKQDLSSLSVYISDSIIQQSSKVRDLVVIFDQFLCFFTIIFVLFAGLHTFI